MHPSPHHPYRFWRSVWVKRFLLLILLVVVFAVGSFLSSTDYSTESSRDYSQGDSVYIESATETEFSDYLKSLTDFSFEEGLTATESESTALETQTRIIKTASLSIDVKNTQETISALNTIADAYEGFVQSSSTWLQSDETVAGSVVLRKPLRPSKRWRPLSTENRCRGRI